MLTTLFSRRSSAEASTTTATKPAPHLGANRIYARVHMNRAFDELYSSPPSRRGEESDRGRFAGRRRHGFTLDREHRYGARSHSHNLKGYVFFGRLTAFALC